MTLSSITRIPIARVYNLRFLVLTLSVQTGVEVAFLYPVDPAPQYCLDLWPLACRVVICVHHILAYATRLVSLT
jgi:hypothetical protein